MTSGALRSLTIILLEYADGAHCRSCISPRVHYLVNLDSWCRRNLGIPLQPVRRLRQEPLIYRGLS